MSIPVLLKINKNDVWKLPKLYRIVYEAHPEDSAKQRMSYLIERSLLTEPMFRRLSVLPEPTIEKLDPLNVQVAVDPSYAKSIPPSSIRRAVLKTLLRESGIIFKVSDAQSQVSA